MISGLKNGIDKINRNTKKRIIIFLLSVILFILYFFLFTDCVEFKFVSLINEQNIRRYLLTFLVLMMIFGMIIGFNINKYMSDKEKNYYKVHGYPKIDDYGNLDKLIEHSMDITSRKEMMEELNMYYKIVEQSPLPIILTDLDANIRYVNPKFTDLTGYEYEEVLGKRISLLKSGKVSDETYKQLWNTITTGNTWKGEFYNKKKDGTFYWERAIITPAINREGKAYQYIAIKEDITEIKKMNQALEDIRNDLEVSKALLLESEKNLKDAQRTSKIAQWQHDYITGEITWTDMIYEILEINDSNKITSHDYILNILHPGDKTSVADLYEESLKNKKSYEIIYRIILGDGKIKWIMEKANIFSNDKGEISKIIGIIQDITELKTAEENLKKETERANKLRILAENSNKAKSDFLATISHEIRTPMNAILGFSKLILESNLSEIQKNYVEKIEISAKSLLGIINNILEISKVESDKLEIENVPFNLNEIIDSVIKIASYAAEEKKLTLIKNIEKEVPLHLIGDKTKLQHILANIVNNAVKFTSKGSVEINVTIIENLLNKCKLMFTIIDTGIGIPPSQLENIFEPFTQAEMSISRMYGGTGLGLTISKKMTELLGGKIYLESIKDEGSTFYIILPFDKQAKSKDSCLIECSDYQHLKELSVLVVEDNDINSELMVNILEKYGIMTEVAENGVQALKKLEEVKFDIILMDISMPIMDGYKTTKEIRKRYGFSVPIIAMTANVFETDINKSLNSGMNDHIGKPIDVDDLLSKINKWSNHNHIKSTIYVKETNIDVYSALNRLGGNKLLYNRLLKEFFESNKNLIIDLEELYKKGKIEDLIMKVHSIKGTSGNLGLSNIYKTSTKIEIDLKENKFEDFTSYLKILEDEIKHSLKEIESIDMDIEDNYKQNLNDLLISLSKLEGYLQDYDIRAIDLINRIHINTEYPQINNKLSRLNALTNKFEFEEAIVIINEINSILKELI